MRTLYRLVYKNGDHGAWDDDIDRIRKYAKFFHAEIEIKNDGGYFGTVPSEVITERIKLKPQEVLIH